jgi:hypothetical protein
MLLAALLMLAVLVSGCGGGEPLQQDNNQGIEALRETLKTAIEQHDAKRVCELLTPALLSNHGGTIAACTKKGMEDVPFNAELDAYLAGGRIELSGDEGRYYAPSSSNQAGEYEATGGEGTDVVFAAIYTDGSWKVTSRYE